MPKEKKERTLIGLEEIIKVKDEAEDLEWGLHDKVSEYGKLIKEAKKGKIDEKKIDEIARYIMKDLVEFYLSRMGSDEDFINTTLRNDQLLENHLIGVFHITYNQLKKIILNSINKKPREINNSILSLSDYYLDTKVEQMVMFDLENPEGVKKLGDEVIEKFEEDGIEILDKSRIYKVHDLLKHVTAIVRGTHINKEYLEKFPYLRMKIKL